MSATFSSQDIEQIQAILYGDMCKLYKFTDNINIDCQSYGNGILTKGEAMVLVHYESLLRENFEAFLQNGYAAPPNSFDDSTFHIPNLLVRYILLPATKDLKELFNAAADNMMEQSRKDSIYLCLGYCAIILISVGGIVSLSAKTAVRVWIVYLIYDISDHHCFLNQ